MHLVFVSSSVPLATPRSGFDIANKVLGEALVDLGHEVTFIGFAPPDAEPAFPEKTRILSRQDFTTDRAGRAQQLRWLASAMVARTGFASAKMLAISGKAFAGALEALAPIDGLVLNSVQLAGAFPDVVAAYPSVYVAHNVEHASANENARVASSLLERMLLRREARHLRRMEELLCRRAKHVFILSEDDRLSLCGDLVVPSSVLPLVTTGTPPAARPAQAVHHDIGLIGTWTWRPNRVGLSWFLDEVVPHLPKEMSVAIAGNIGNTPSCAHPGVRFLGRVEDARDFVETSGVVALASRGGTGVQLKTLEAFELGLPTVATHSALRGIAERPENCTVADDPQAFAQALIETASRRRAGAALRVDGAAFHGAQRTSLMAALDAGLRSLAVPSGETLRTS